MRVCQQPQLQGFFWTEHCWAHLNAPGAPTARRWRHLSARRTAEQQKLFVDVLFWSLWAGFLQVWTPNRVSWSWSPPFAPAVTHQCGNPAKMKWMFKEDHSLGKKGLGCCYETREMSSFHVACFSFLLRGLCVLRCGSTTHHRHTNAGFSQEPAGNRSCLAWHDANTHLLQVV